MENKTTFDGFSLNGVDYYFYKGEYYADNITVTMVISAKEYRHALMSKMIKDCSIVKS